MLALGPFFWATDAARVEPRSVLVACLLVFCVFFLAYLSNPSEASFRSYLTEQSFRHHLSRLDDPAHDHESKDQDDCSPASLEQGGSAVHFSSRAAVALRTPKHAFHSFGFFTIAAVLPGTQPKAGLGAVHTAAETKEAWFVGAFGRWWKGGYVDPSWPAPTPRKGKASVSDDDAWSSGIMTVKALDKHDKHDGLPLPASSAARNARNPPKLRSRDRSKPRNANGHNTPRSSTPPPLPKSVTLPLHTPRRSSHGQSQTLTVPSPHHQPQQQSNPAQTLKEKEAEYASAPVVVDLLSRIKNVQGTNKELKGQLADHASQSAQAERNLNEELARSREEKRVEDAARAEAKSRTKTLEEARRAAEAARRDAERRLAGARKVIEDARAIVSSKESEFKAFKEREENDKMRKVEVEEEGRKEVEEIGRKVKRAVKEAKVAEDVVGALGARARELEEAIAVEVAKLEQAREKARLVQLERPRGWIDRQLAQHAPVPVNEDEPIDVFPTPLEKDSDARSRSSGSGSRSTGSREVSASPGPRPSPLNLRAISNIPERDTRKGYTVFDEDIAGLGLGLGIPGLPGYAGHNGLSSHASHAPGVPHPHIPGHPPLQTSAIDIPQMQKDLLDKNSPASIDMSSPTAAGLIPGSLIRSLERGEPLPASPDQDDNGMMSASFTSDGDAILGRDWRPVAPSAVGAPVGEFGQVMSHRPVSHAGSVGSMHSLVSLPSNSRVGSLSHPQPFTAAPFVATPSTTSTVFGSGSAPTTASYASTLASSPTSAKFPLPDDGDLSGDFDPFAHAPTAFRRSTVSLDNQRAAPAPRLSMDGQVQRPPWTPPRTPDVPVPVEGKRKWWGAGKDKGDKEHKPKDDALKDKAPIKKGLNPDAKVFRFGRKSAPAATLAPPPSVIGSPARSPNMPHTIAQQHQPFDSLNPSGFPSPPRAGMGGFLSNLSLRAFAPSPAEREALKRALGAGAGSASASLERLPSLGGGLGSAGLDRLDGSLERLVSAGNERDEVYEAPGRITFSPWGEAEE